MKKLFFTLLTLCLCGATYAQDNTITDSNGLIYNILTTGDNQVEVGSNTSYSGTAVEIPATVTDNGTTYTVVGIADGAFGSYNASGANTNITSVSIPNTVTYVGSDLGSMINAAGCFGHCSSLTSVTFEDGIQLTTIGSYAFYYCSGLTSIDIPSTVTAIYANAFAYCTGLTEVKIPEGVTSMGSNEFQGCTNLETVWMPGSLTLTARVFDSCTSLKNIVLEGEPGENGGTEGNNAFYNDGGEEITLYVETGRAAEYLDSKWADDVANDTDETLSWNFNIYTDGISENAGDGQGTYYATYYTDAVGEFGDDVTPCIVTGVEEGEDGSAVNYSSISGYIPANTGVLLVAQPENALNSSVDTYYYHPYGVTEATANVSGNMLYGNLVDAQTTLPAETGYYYYKLSRDSSGTANSVGFYWGADGGAAFTNPAGKAYLSLPSDSNSSSGISLKKGEGEDTTGISSIESASEKAVSGIYTIQGVRVSNMNQPGLYIVDGKKVLVK